VMLSVCSVWPAGVKMCSCCTCIAGNSNCTDTQTYLGGDCTQRGHMYNRNYRCYTGCLRQLAIGICRLPELCLVLRCSVVLAAGA
jgi:hypothetical protein